MACGERRYVARRGALLVRRCLIGPRRAVVVVDEGAVAPFCPQQSRPAGASARDTVAAMAADVTPLHRARPDARMRSGRDMARAGGYDPRTEVGRPDARAWRRAIGRRLRDAREGAGLRLVDVAAAARVSPQYLSEVERGRKEASSEVLAAVTGALGMTLGDLAGGLARDLGRPTSVRGPVVLAA